MTLRPPPTAIFRLRTERETDAKQRSLLRSYCKEHTLWITQEPELWRSETVVRLP